MRLALDRHAAHRWPGDRFADRVRRLARRHWRHGPPHHRQHPSSAAGHRASRGTAASGGRPGPAPGTLAPMHARRHRLRCRRGTSVTRRRTGRPPPAAAATAGPHHPRHRRRGDGRRSRKYRGRPFRPLDRLLKKPSRASVSTGGSRKLFRTAPAQGPARATSPGKRERFPGLPLPSGCLGQVFSSLRAVRPAASPRSRLPLPGRPQADTHSVRQGRICGVVPGPGNARPSFGGPCNRNSRDYRCSTRSRPRKGLPAGPRLGQH